MKSVTGGKARKKEEIHGKRKEKPLAMARLLRGRKPNTKRDVRKGSEDWDLSGQHQYFYAKSS